MPKRTDLEHVLVIGSGPILIGQAAEFDYSGTQACRVLREEGLRVSLVNSNPATIMTDPEVADATYIEPLTPEFVEKVIASERPDALLATLGGQTALNIAIGLFENGVLEKYGVQLIGADVDGDQPRRGPAAVQGHRAVGRRRRAALAGLQLDRRGARDGGRGRLPGRHPALASPWAASARASRPTRTSCGAWPRTASPTRRCTRC